MKNLSTEGYASYVTVCSNDVTFNFHQISSLVVHAFGFETKAFTDAAVRF